MQKINLKIDVSKLNKEKFTKNSFTKRDGTQVNEVNAELVLVEKKEYRDIKDGDTWVLKETHFIAEKGDKDEQSNYVGVGTQFFDKNEVATGQVAEDIKNLREQHNNEDENMLDPSLIPF